MTSFWYLRFCPPSPNYKKYIRLHTGAVIWWSLPLIWENDSRILQFVPELTATIPPFPVVWLSCPITARWLSSGFDLPSPFLYPVCGKNRDRYMNCLWHHEIFSICPIFLTGNIIDIQADLSTYRFNFRSQDNTHPSVIPIPIGNIYSCHWPQRQQRLLHYFRE